MTNKSICCLKDLIMHPRVCLSEGRLTLLVARDARSVILLKDGRSSSSGGWNSSNKSAQHLEVR